MKPLKEEPGEHQDQYRSVTIVCNSDACEAAKSITGKHIFLRFVHLFPLPLPECDGRKCLCKYRHHNDRRDPEDRRSPYNYTVYLERRAGADRRKNKPDET